MGQRAQIINKFAGWQIEEEIVRDFNRGGGGRGGRRFDNRGGGGGGGRGHFDRGERQMHDAMCANCGKDCQVPFRPTGEKPVYCRACFDEQGGNDRNRSNDRGNRGGNRRNDNRSSGPNYQSEFDAVNKKLETILDIVLKLKKNANIEQHDATLEEAIDVVEEVVEDVAEEVKDESEEDFS